MPELYRFDLRKRSILDTRLRLTAGAFSIPFNMQIRKHIMKGLKVMPWKPKTICSYPGCQTLSHDRYCDKHKKQMAREENEKSSKLYTYQWRKASKEFLKKHPLCIHCEREGRLTPATEVDHIRPHGGDRKLFWNKKNWQPLCKNCHSKKTALEDGGFGNKPSHP